MPNIWINSSNEKNVCKWSALKRVTSVKYLGLFIDESLKWDVHIIIYINN